MKVVASTKRTGKVFSISDQFEIHLGDCLEFLKKLPDESVDLIVTDPAYSGMNNKMSFGNGRIVGKYQDEKNDKWFPEFKDDPANFLILLKEFYRVLKNDRHLYVMMDSFSLLSLGHIIRDVFNMKNIIVWDKKNIGMGHHFRRRHEFILFASKGSRKLNRRNIPDVWEAKRITRNKYPTQKPVKIFDLMMESSAEPGFVVCDPFLGSGSSAIAALKAGCSFVGADVSEKACKLSSERVLNFLKTEKDILENV